ncbi:D-aminoacyl-tRNA deacylase-like [Homalodisca vitripennis]|uniref:D-aminoacyl-tRNA deacylase-like n=1 Tax=Homalodisca vitripennis TaxID=197043 RepID=UPI001EEB106B|nr:D-aminoacyl-tRNA deacylase-like [Homalodisca vitripennis]
MRAVVQRVQNASVTVDGLVISAIGHGLLVWVGFGSQDKSSDLHYMVNTLLSTRLFHSEHNAHRWTRTVMDCGYEILVLSQISLYSTMYLEKPYFYQAMNARRSKPYYERFLRTLRRTYQPDKIREGRFGAGYSVTTQTRGPVFIIESFNEHPISYMGPIGPPPPYPYHPPPMYGGPPPPHVPVNQSYQAAPPPYPYPDYPNYPTY